MATSHRAILAALLLAACDIPSGDPGCLSGRDVSNWMVTEHDPAAVTTPIVSCGKTVGYAIELPDGLRSNVLWALEAQFPVVAGSKVKLGADIAANPDATMFRASMDEIVCRSETGTGWTCRHKRHCLCSELRDARDSDRYAAEWGLVWACHRV